MIHDLDLLLSLVRSPVRSVAAVGVSLFGEREDVANARVEFEDGCVANLTASRASFQAVRKMRVWGADGYATLDFATKQATLVRPSERLKRGEIDVSGIDLTQPATIKEHIFGAMLQVDQVPPPAVTREPLAEELEDFVRAIRQHAAPRVPGTEALRHAAGRPDRLQPGSAPMGRPARRSGRPARHDRRHPRSRPRIAGAEGLEIPVGPTGYITQDMMCPSGPRADCPGAVPRVRSP